MKYIEIVKKAEFVTLSYSLKNNLSAVFIPTEYGELIKIYPNKKLLPDTGDFTFFDKKILSYNYIPINGEYFDEKNSNFEYSPLRGRAHVFYGVSNSVDCSGYSFINYVPYCYTGNNLPPNYHCLPDTIREGGVFIGKKEYQFYNNSYLRKIKKHFYKRPDLLYTCKASDLLSAIQNLFNNCKKSGEYRGDKFYKTPQKYAVKMFPTCQGSAITLKAQDKYFSFNACLKRDSLKINRITLNASDLGYFADAILPHFKGKLIVAYFDKGRKCIIRDKTKAFVLKARNNKACPPNDRRYSVRYNISDTKAFKNAILEACSNVYGLGGKKASLNICIDFLYKEIIVHSYNKLRDELKTTTIKQEKLNTGYPIIQYDNVYPLSRLYLDANDSKKIFAAIADNDRGLVLSVYEGKYIEIKTDNLNCSLAYKTEKDIQEEKAQTREEEVKELKEQLKIIVKEEEKLCDLINHYKTLISDAQGLIEDIEYKAKIKGRLTVENAKKITRLENKIGRYNNHLYDYGEGKKLFKGLYTKLEEEKREEKRVTMLLDIMDKTSLSFANAVYSYKRYTDKSNKETDDKGNIILHNGEPIYKKTIDEITKNAVTSEKDNSIDLTTLIDYEREEQEKINVSLLEEELKQHKLLLKEEKARAKQAEKERKAREKAWREKARQEKKQQEEKAKQERAIARQKAREEKERARQEEKAQKRNSRKYDPLDYILDLDRKTELLDNYQPQEIKVDIPDYSVKKPYNNYTRRNINKQENNLIYALVGYGLLGSITAAITALVLYIL